MPDVTVQVKIDTKPLEELKASVEKKLAKRAMRAAAKVLLQEARIASPFLTGALKKSFASKVDSIKGESNAYAVIGPRSSFIKVTKSGVKLQPSRYAAPLNKRTPFLKEALARKQAECIAILNKTYADEIAKLSTT